MIHDDLRQIKGLISRLQSSRNGLKSFVNKLRSSSLSYKTPKVSSEDLSLRAEKIVREIDRLAADLDLVYRSKRNESRKETPPAPRRQRKK